MSSEDAKRHDVFALLGSGRRKANRLRNILRDTETLASLVTESVPDGEDRRCALNHLMHAAGHCWEGITKEMR